MSGAERAKGAASRYALAMVKRQRRADGGAVTGPLLGVGGGRTDTLPISVPAGAFVMPADVVSGFPGAQGNSLQGHAALTKLFNSLPLSPDEAPYGAPSPDLPRGHTMLHGASGAGLASGGSASNDEHGESVPILAAPGEFVVHPKFVKRFGFGNLKRGHEMLDEVVDWVRKKNIENLKKLPGTVKN